MTGIGCASVKKRPIPSNGREISCVSDPIIRKVLAARGIGSESDLDLSLAGLEHYRTLKGIDEASELLSAAVRCGKRIVVVGDYDVDGATSTALAVLALREMGAAYVSFYIPDRVTMGYGLSVSIVEELAAGSERAELIVTVDNGMTSVDAVKRAHELNIDVIITDHHLAGSEIPEADAIVNPNQPGCQFASKYAAGVGVIFYVVSALRAKLKDCGWFESSGLAYPNLGNYLDLVAVGSLADVVPLDKNNRILIKAGIEKIRNGRGRLCFERILEVSRKSLSRVTEGEICCSITPVLNAAGRINNMSLGVHCLMSDNPEEVAVLVSELMCINDERREMESAMRDTALASVAKVGTCGGNSIVAYDSSFHQGIIGLVASRLKDSSFLPSVVFADAEPGFVRGSARSVTGLNIKQALDKVFVSHPGTIIRYGGHAMAAGMTVAKDKLSDFKIALSEAISDLLAGELPDASLLSDGELPPDRLTVAFYDELCSFGPWGSRFEFPLFDGVFDIVSVKIIKDRHLRLTVIPVRGGYEQTAMSFNLSNVHKYSSLVGSRVRMCYRLDVNEWRGERSLTLIIESLQPF